MKQTSTLSADLQLEFVGCDSTLERSDHKNTSIFQFQHKVLGAHTELIVSMLLNEY